MALARTLADTREEKQTPQDKNLKERIEGSISHFFYDLPTDPIKLKENVLKIKHAFHLELKAKDITGQEEPYFSLQKSTEKPELFFEPLEKIKPNVKKGEIQTLIINLATHNIKQAADEAKIDLQTLEWNEDEVIASFKTKIGEEFNKPFKTNRAAMSAEQLNPPEAKIPDNVIYQVHLEEDFNALVLNYSVIVKLDDTPSDPINDYLILETIEDLEEQTEKALYIAEEIAIEMALEHLHITRMSNSVKKLITHNYYFNLLKTNPETLDDIIGLSLETTKTLLLPTIIALLEHKKCTIPIAKTLTPDELKVIKQPFYYQQLIKNELTIQDFIGINAKKSKNLIYPNITQLIQLKKITFKQAKRISTSYRCLLQHEYYFDLIRTDKLSFHKLKRVTKEQSKNLATAIIVYLISNKKISLKQALSYTISADCQKLLNKKLYINLIQNNVVTLDTLLALNSEECKELCTRTYRRHIRKKIITFNHALMIINNPLILFLLKQNLLSFKEVTYIGPARPDAFPLEFNKEYDCNSFRRIIIDFLELAKDGLLIEEDLTILYTYLDGIHLSNNESKEEKTSLGKISLLDNKTMSNCCRINLYNRLNEILVQSPRTLPNGEIDTLETLIDSLNKFSSPPIDIWAQIFGLKLLNVYKNNLNGMEALKKSIDEITPTLIISFSQFKDKIIAHFFRSLTCYFETVNPPNCPQLQMLYHNISSLYDEAGLNENAIPPLPGPSAWQRALNALMYFTNNFITPFHHDSHVERNDNVPKRTRLSLGLFTAKTDFVGAYKNILILSKMLNQLGKPSVDLSYAENKSGESESLKRKRR